MLHSFVMQNCSLILLNDRKIHVRLATIIQDYFEVRHYSAAIFLSILGVRNLCDHLNGTYTNKFFQGGDYIIPFCRNETSTRPAGRFHPTITWENQISSRQGGTVFHLVFFQVSLHFLFIPL